jgi:hypothetical protein
MCQACLALARRKSGASNWPLGDSGAQPAARFGATADWADAPEENDAAAPEVDAPPVDAQRS